jgi:hypothetical protein
MATMYLVQGYKQKGRSLVADAPQKAKTAEAAIALAERLAPNRTGIFAYSQEIDIETDTYDEPRMLWRAGTLPPGLLD